MQLRDCHLLIISHAGIKQINRSVYRALQKDLGRLTVVIPRQLQLGSGQRIVAEPRRPDDPVLVPMTLLGRNPRTYFYAELTPWLTTNRPNLILVENDPASRLGFQVMRWCKANRAKIICQTYENLKRDFITSFRNYGLRPLVKNLAVNLLSRWMASRTDALLVVNSDSEAIFGSYGYRNICRIPLGYDKKVFYENEESRKSYRKRISVGGDTIVIAYFGRLVRQKGVHLLIEALSVMKHFNWVLLLDHIHDSENEYAQEIRNLIDRNFLQDRVIYFEADHFEIASYMRAADISVAPSITTPAFKEQYGRAVQEAMACGCVTIVSDSGHLKDLVGDTSLVFRENDVNMLRNCLIDLLQDEAKRRVYRSTLQERAETHLTTEAQSQRLRRMLEGLLR